MTHIVDPSDEYRHVPGAEPLWNESYYLDFVTEEDGIAGYARIGLYPNLGVTWWTTMLVGADRPTVASLAFDLPVAAGTGLHLERDGLDVRGVVEEPLTTMSLKGRAAARRLEQPDDLYRGVPGHPTTVALDLTWTTDGTPYHYDLTTRYEVPCRVDGEVMIGRERLPVSGWGQRDHSWGVRDWWSFGWCWAAARLDDGLRLHVADIRIPGQRLAFGYLQPADGSVQPLTSLEISEELGPGGLPSRARARLAPGDLDLRIEPQRFGPLLLESTDGRLSRFPRALARFETDDGRRGLGWVEWNQPDPAA